MLPEVMAIAGPNGSGKTTVSALTVARGTYINADDIKRATHCTDLEAAVEAERLREDCLAHQVDFTFETVLSTPRNLLLLRRAREQGYFVRCIYVLTASEDINVARVRAREMAGGHGVPEEKVRARYRRAISLIPEIVAVCDIMHVYDNSGPVPFRIFKKRKREFFAAPNEFWDLDAIARLTGVSGAAPFPREVRQWQQAQP